MRDAARVSTAVERVLWLNAIDRCLRPTPDDPPSVHAAYGRLRVALGRDARRGYATAVVDEAHELVWLLALQATGATDGAVLLAAVSVWTDAGRAPWSRLAMAALRLAGAVEVGGDERAAMVLRARMAAGKAAGDAR